MMGIGDKVKHALGMDKDKGKGRRVRRSKPAAKAEKSKTGKAGAEQQMSSEELEAQARVHGVIRTSVAAHGGLGVPWSMDDLPNPDPPPPPELDAEAALAQEGRLRAAALGGFGPELTLEKPKASARA
jgi:hypothetical protein